MRQELSPFDVNVVIIRPGAIKTEWTDIAAQSLLKVSGQGPYAKATHIMYALFTSDRLAKMSADPSVIADAVETAVTVKCPRSVYTAPLAGRMMVRIQRWAGFDSLRDMITRSFMGLPKRM